ncbi:MAG: hypothetical protein AB7O50_00720 [Pseudolabrys sp.]
MLRLVLSALTAAPLLLASYSHALDQAPIPDGVIARASSGDIVEAVLIGKTTRYRHFVLGSDHEAAGLRVKTADGKTLVLMLPQDSVFEDREPRIADLDGDGRNEVVTIRSRLTTGSALAVLGLRDGKLAILAESPPNGAANRWLNPSSIGDFLGNGKKQIAMVRMPHVVGRLEFWAFDGKMLTLRGSFGGTSNHRIGTKTLNLSAVLPRPAPRGDLLAIPSLDRQTLRIVAALPSPREVASYRLDGEAGGKFAVRKAAGGFVVAVPLRGGGKQDVVIGADVLAR